MTLFEPLERWAAETPDKEAVVYQDRRFTYAQYNQEVDRAAKALIGLGVERGDKVALYIPNHSEFLFCYLGCAKLGAVAVPVSWRFAPPEVSYVLGHSDASAIIMETGFGGSDFIASFNAVRDGLPGMQRVVVIGGDEDVSRVKGAVSWEDFLAGGEGKEEELDKMKARVEEDDTA
ncbi:MAG: AMP-binding protein, partial [Actinomycetota bacterium]